MDMGAPETRYARSGDVMVAYQVVGNGPFDAAIAVATARSLRDRPFVSISVPTAAR